MIEVNEYSEWSDNEIEDELANYKSERALLQNRINELQKEVDFRIESEAVFNDKK